MRSSGPLLLLLCTFSLLWPRPGLAIEIGSVSELDLEEMHRLLDQSGELPAPAPAGHRALSLREALGVALESNLRLQIASLEVEAQAPELAATRAKFHPTVGAEAGGGANADEDETYAALGFARQELPTGGSLTLSAGYLREDSRGDTADEIAGYILEGRLPLLRGGRRYVAGRAIHEAEYDLEIEQAQLRAEILTVTAETKAAYYDTVLAGRLIEVVRSAIERDRELLEASQALFDAGRVNRRDVLSAELQLANDSAELATRSGDLEVAQNRLRDVLGLPIDRQIDVTDRTIPFRPVEIRLDEWIRQAKGNRPELLEIGAELAKSDLAIRNRRNDVLPALDLFGIHRQDFRFANRDWQAGLLVEIPVGNVAARSRLERAQALHARLERRRLQLERRIELEVREIEIRLRETVGRVRARTQGVENARGKREVAQVRFEMGLANNLDITDADEDLVSAESDLLRAVVDYATNLAFLEARVAGRI